MKTDTIDAITLSKLDIGREGLFAISFIILFLASITGFGQTPNIDTTTIQNMNGNVSVVNQRIDSIRTSFTQRLDSLKNTYENKLTKLDSLKACLQIKKDSLMNLKVPVADVTSKLDSIDRLREKTIARFDRTLRAIKTQATDKLPKLDLHPALNERIASMKKDIESTNIVKCDKVLTTADFQYKSLGKGIAPNKLNDMLEMNYNDQLQTDFSNQIKKLSLPDEAGKYARDARELANGNVSDATHLVKTVEEKAAAMSGLHEMEDQAGMNQFKEIAPKMQDSDALKKATMEKAKQIAQDHFAGKQEQLKAAMSKLSKYKQIYSSINGLNELSKRRHNLMTGKLLIERIVPGINIQLQRKGGDLLVDFNPYACYRFTERFRAGLGWNQRIAYKTNLNVFNSGIRIYGPRIFSEVKVWKGFSPCAEVEVMNAFISPSQQTGTMDPISREWVWGAFVGLKKEYNLIKNIKGTGSVMVRLFNPDSRLYADILNIRFGFEFPMKKKTENTL